MAEYSQIQMHKDIKNMASKINRMEEELRSLVKKLEKQRDSGLDKGLMELKEGKFHTYKNVAELDKAIRKRNH